MPWSTHNVNLNLEQTDVRADFPKPWWGVMPVESRHGWDESTGPEQWGGACGGDGSAETLLVTAWLEEMGAACTARVAFSRKHRGRTTACVQWGEEEKVSVPCPKKKRGEKGAWARLLLSSPRLGSDTHWLGITPLQVRMNKLRVLLERNGLKFNFSFKDQITRCVKHVQPLGPLGWIQLPKTSLLCPQHIKSNVSQIVSKRLFTYACYCHDAL